MKYRSTLNQKKQRSLLLKVKLSILLFVIVVLTGALVFYLKYVREDSSNTPESTTSSVTVSTVAPEVNIFRSPFFQFQAPGTWLEVKNESTANKFVYRGIRSGLIEHQMDIYVSQIPSNLESNRVLPVQFVKSNTELSVSDSVSEHCIKANDNKPTIERLTVTLKEVSFRCDADSRDYTVFIGEKTGDTLLNLVRPNGVNENYVIYYRNLTAAPDTKELVEIIDTFQTR